MLNLSTKLKENGIDTTVLNDNISQSTIIISKHLNILLTGELTVDINGKKYTANKELNEKLLQESKRLLLETGEQDINPKVE
jgi:hypothetical protein